MTLKERRMRNEAMLPGAAYRKLPARVRQNLDEFEFIIDPTGPFPPLIFARYGGDLLSVWDGKNWVLPTRTERERFAHTSARDTDHRFQMPGGLELTPEEQARMRKSYRRASKLRALRRGVGSGSGSGHFQAPKGVRDPKRALTWKQDGYLHFAHGPEGMWMIEQRSVVGRKSRFLLTLDLAGGSILHDTAQDFGSHATLAKAKAEAARGHRSFRTQARDPRLAHGHGGTWRDLHAFATEVRVLLFARGLPKSAVVAAVERARATVYDAWRTGKSPKVVADKLLPALARESAVVMRDPRRKVPRRKRKAGRRKR